MRDYVLVEEMPAVTVKGKSEKIRLFALVNIPTADDIPGAGKEGPSSLKDVRELLGLPTPDFEKVNLDAEEKKYSFEA